MSAWFYQLGALIYSHEFLKLLFLFLIAFFSANWIYSLKNTKKNKIIFCIIKILIIFPEYMINVIHDILKKRWSFPELFLFILVYNSFSVFTGFISGFVPYFPYILIFITGLNIGLLSVISAPKSNTAILLVNPVAILEIVAICIAFSLGLQLEVKPLQLIIFREKLVLYNELLRLVYKFSFLLLLIAAIIESTLIVLFSKFENQ